jgi:hypothetical protein
MNWWLLGGAAALFALWRRAAATPAGGDPPIAQQLAHIAALASERVDPAYTWHVTIRPDGYVNIECVTCPEHGRTGMGWPSYQGAIATLQRMPATGKHAAVTHGSKASA